MTLIFGHAGTATAPSNTLESFQSVIDQQADGLVKDHTYAELARLNASTSVEGYPPTRIPLLADVLDMFSQTGLEVNIEIKSGVVIYPGIEQEILDIVNRAGMSRHVCYSSFNHYSLLAIRQIEPHALIAPLYSTGLVNPWDYVASLPAQAVHPFFLNLTAAAQMVPGLDPIEEFHRRHIIVRAWTVDDPVTLHWLFAHDVDAVITNQPALARRVLDDVNSKQDRNGNATDANQTPPSSQSHHHDTSEHDKQGARA